MSEQERRRYRRIEAPIYCRPAGMKFMERHQAIDLSLGGVRIYSDEPFKIGESLKLEVFVDDEQATFTAEVVWITKLPPGEPAKYDVGLKFSQLDPHLLQVLTEVLGPPESERVPPPKK